MSYQLYTRDNYTRAHLNGLISQGMRYGSCKLILLVRLVVSAPLRLCWQRSLV